MGRWVKQGGLLSVVAKEKLNARYTMKHKYVLISFGHVRSGCCCCYDFIFNPLCSSQNILKPEKVQNIYYQIFFTLPEAP